MHKEILDGSAGIRPGRSFSTGTTPREIPYRSKECLTTVMEDSRDPRVAVIGAGPVGCLAAITLANRGFHVDIYERRPDPRSHQISSSDGKGDGKESAPGHVDRSINLAISARGLKALSKVQQERGDSLADVVLRHAVPMRARMIHTRDEGQGVKLMSQPYSTKGEVSKARR